jgi:hypothetical protein
MTRQADVAVYDSDGNLQLVVEIKKKLSATLEWVTQMRQNLLIHSLVPNAPYFLLALPDFFYLWKNSSSINELASPDYKIETTEILGPYVKRSNLSLTEMSQYGLEFVVNVWLEDLVNSELTRDTADPALQALFDSGLYPAIKNGSIAIEAEALA